MLDVGMTGGLPLLGDDAATPLDALFDDDSGKGNATRRGCSGPPANDPAGAADAVSLRDPEFCRA
jgi:hypothetical protein